MSNDILATLRRRAGKAPTGPGVYRWLDKDGTVIYVGKAKNVRNRLRTYVQQADDASLGPWKRSMKKQLADFDVTVVNSELEALVLETNLIKQLRPRYNVLMKDDKNYVYVKITVNDPFPTVEIVRNMNDSSAKYFGPFLSSYDTKRTLDMLHQVFGFRGCKQSIDLLNRMHGDVAAMIESNKIRPCLDYQIGRCCGTCAGKVSQEDYADRIQSVMYFLKGNYDAVIDQAKALMERAATEKKFEKAAELRDTIAYVESLKDKQIVSDTSGENADVVGMALLSGKVQAVLMQKRGGRLLADRSFALAGAADSVADALEQFLPQYYSDAVDLPDELIVSEDFPSRETLEFLLTEQHGKKVRVIVPERGKKSKLLELAEKNALQKAKQAEASWEAEKRNTEGAVQELADVLGLSEPPKRIEGYDISHTGGTETVGSMVVCIDGKPKNDHYRSFTIHTMASGVVDDYRALKEVLTRRLRHVVGGLAFEEKKWNEGGVTFGKARKAEQSFIQEVIERHPEEHSQTDIDYKQYIVARYEEDIVGFVRLRTHDQKLLELSTLWVDERFRGNKLGQFLARKLLHSIKKGKVYLRIFPDLEQYYASVGFRHVIKSPKVFEERLAAAKKENPDLTERLVMVYDTTQHKTDSSLSSKPDLLVIDGGKGQLSTIVSVLKSFELDIPVIGLAKREEEVFVPGAKVSIILPKDSPAKFLLMRLRDEAHRFANSHRKKRAFKTMITSALDSIPSIGPDTKKALLQHFGSVDAIRRATDEELTPFVTEEQLQGIREKL